MCYRLLYVWTTITIQIIDPEFTVLTANINDKTAVQTLKQFVKNVITSVQIGAWLVFELVDSIIIKIIQVFII